MTVTSYPLRASLGSPRGFMAERIKPIGSGKPDISLIDAAIVTLTKEMGEVKAEVKSVRSDNNSIIIGVLIALVVIVVAVAVQVILANKVTGDSVNADMKFNDKLNSQEIEINNLRNKVDNIKTLNPFLK
jgi:hypothetical protein